MHPAVEQLRHLPVQERLLIIEQLWEGISASDESLPLQDWHREEAARRAEAFDQDPAKGLTREEFWSQVRKPHG